VLDAGEDLEVDQQAGTHNAGETLSPTIPPDWVSCCACPSATNAFPAVVMCDQGVSIELVITYLRKWLRIERTHVGRLLWSYPLDYSLPRLVLPIDTAAAADSSMDEPPANPSSSSSNSGATSSPAAASTAQASSSSSSSSGSSNSSGQEEQPRQVPAWGAAEACSWLDIDLKKGGSSSSSSSSEDGAGGSSSSNSNGDASPPDAGSDASGGGKQPPSAA